jgi:poly(3-hydroxybutyrate) depolymerase
MRHCLVFALAAGLLSFAPKSSHSEAPPETSAEAVSSLERDLGGASVSIDGILKKPFAGTPLTRNDADTAAALIRKFTEDEIRSSRSEEMKQKVVTMGDLSMPFFYRKFGSKPKRGWSLFISMHGGGGVAARVNDQQWENQKRLYQLKEGIYLAPRAATNAWNLWHQGHIDGFFSRLITNLVVFEGVDPDRVFLMGYSAGGDGVYQLAPRMADQFAAAAMMAGHPNETSPLGLRNLPFAIHVGEKDAGYGRNARAKDWKIRLADLQKKDADGYTHLVKLHAGKGHWMDRQDAEAISWMAKFRRNSFPLRMVWKLDAVVHDRFYWLAVSPRDVKPRGEIVATRDGQTIRIEKSDAARVSILLTDELVKLDEEIVIVAGQKELFRGVVPRTIRSLAETIRDRGGLSTAFSARLEVAIPKPQEPAKSAQ